MFIADSKYVYSCCVICYLNHVFNLLNINIHIEKLLLQDTDVLCCTINKLINFVVSIKIINIKLIHI